MNKRNAFISGNPNLVSYVVPSKNYKYYQNKLNKLLKHTNPKIIAKFHKEIRTLNHRRSRRSSKYLKLYELVYGARQNVRVNYHNHIAKINNYNHKEVDHNSKRPVNNSVVSTASVNLSQLITPSYVATASSVASNTDMTLPSSVTTNTNERLNSSTSVPVVVPSMTSKESSKESRIDSMNSYYAKSGAESADYSIANSYRASVSASVAIINQAKAKSAASVADQKLDSSIAASYASSAENTGSYKNSLSVANSKAASAAAQVADNKLESSIASSYANSANQSIANSVARSVAIANNNVAKSAQQSADRSIANSYATSVSNSVSVMDNSIANSAAISADQSIADSVSESAKSQAAIDAMLTDMKDQVFSDINNDREKDSKPALELDSGMDKIANLRAKQLSHNFSHYDKNNNNETYYTEDAQRLDINLNDYTGENIGEDYPGYLSQEIGKNIADLLDDEMMNHDAASNLGHRKNILNPNYTSVGIGVYYNDGTFYLSEDFESNN